MKLFTFIIKLTLIVSFFHAPKIVANVDPLEIDRLLLNADKLRPTRSPEFNDILTQIEPHFDRLEISQKYYFLLLNGYKSFYNGELDQAKNMFSHVKDNSQSIELKYRASSSLVNLFSFTKNWISGFEALDFIVENYESISNNEFRHQGLITASNFYNELEQYEMTLSLVRRLFDEQVSGRNLCMAYSVKLNADLNSNIYESLQDELIGAIDTCKSVNETMVVSVMRVYLGNYYISKGLFLEASEYIEKHYQEIESNNSRLMKIEADSILAVAYFNQNMIDKAKQFASNVVASKTSSEEYLKVTTSAYRILSAISRQEQNYDLAFELQEKYTDINEKLFESTKAKQLAIESAKHRAIEKDNQIEILNNQNRILQLENKLSSETAVYNRWIIVLLGTIVTILVLWVFYVKRSQQKLKYLAEFDSLTRISNRAYFNQSAETVLNYYSKTNRTASLVLFDLDNFKKINDTYGHPIGDEVLKLAAEACKACVRKVDIFGRVGGEEFAMLLPGCELEQALKIAEDCRAKIESIDTSTLGMQGKITASFGVADSASTGYLLKDLTANADEAMYLAKRRGRNRVVNYQSSE